MDRTMQLLVLVDFVFRLAMHGLSNVKAFLLWQQALCDWQCWQCHQRDWEGYSDWSGDTAQRLAPAHWSKRHTHTRIYIYIYIHARTHTRKYINIYIYIHARAHTHVNTHTHMHTCLWHHTLFRIIHIVINQPLEHHNWLSSTIVLGNINFNNFNNSNNLNNV